MYYNLAAGSFLSKKLCSTLHSIEVDFYSKNRQIGDFDSPFRGVRDNPRHSLMARWKARRDLLFIIIELFSLACTVETLQAEICRRGRFSKVGGSIRSPILGRKGRRPPTTVGWQKARRIALSCGIKNIAGTSFGLVTKHACDRRTDRITTPKTALA